MQNTGHFEQELRQATLRSSAVPLAPDLQAMRSAFLNFGQSLENQARLIDETALLQQAFKASTPTDDNFVWTWNVMLALAASLVVFVSSMAYLSQQQNHERLATIQQRSTPSSIPQTVVAMPKIGWQDDWDARFEAAEANLTTFPVSRWSASDMAASWLDATMREIQGEIMAEAM